MRRTPRPLPACSEAPHCTPVSRRYTLLSLAPRLVHVLNLCRCCVEVQPRARRDTVLQLLEHVIALPIWAAAFIHPDFAPTVALFGAAAVVEVAAVVFEPAHALYRHLERRGTISTVLDTIPIDVEYAEKRWHRLLMIALAMLPSFAPNTFSYSFTRDSLPFMITSSVVRIVKGVDPRRPPPPLAPLPKPLSHAALVRCPRASP